MGDLLITSLSQALNIPILIATARTDTDVILVESKQCITSTPIFVAYNHEGRGHFDALISKAPELKVNQPSKNISGSMAKMEVHLWIHGQNGRF